MKNPFTQSLSPEHLQRRRLTTSSAKDLIETNQSCYPSCRKTINQNQWVQEIQIHEMSNESNVHDHLLLRPKQKLLASRTLIMPPCQELSSRCETEPTESEHNLFVASPIETLCDKYPVVNHEAITSE